MNDDLQKEIDNEVKGAKSKQPEALKKTDLDEIFLKPVTASSQVKKTLAGEAKDLETKARAAAAETLLSPKSIADLLKIGGKTTKDAPKNLPPKPSPPPTPKAPFPPISPPITSGLTKKGSVIASSDKITFFSSSVPERQMGALNKNTLSPSPNLAEDEIGLKTFNLDSPIQSQMQSQGASEFPPLKRDSVPSKISERLKASVKTIDYVPKSEAPVTKNLRTLKGDMQEAMTSGKATLVSMAAAEANRRAEIKSQLEHRPAPAPKMEHAPSGRGVKIFAGILSVLLIGAGAAAFYFLNQNQTAPVIIVTNKNFLPSLIPVQFETKINIDGHNASYVRASFDAERKRNKGNLNELGNVLFTTGVNEEEKSLTKDEFFAATAIHPPEELNRTLLPDYMAGIHRFPENQTFMVFETDSYESASAGMLAWEGALEEEVGKFLRSPNDFAYPAGKSPNLNQRKFIDKVYKNIDTRALYDESGNLLFFYAFLNRKYLVMTTDPETLGVIISGLSARTVTR